MPKIGHTPLIPLTPLREAGCDGTPPRPYRRHLRRRYIRRQCLGRPPRARILGPGKRVVTIIVDSGLKYLNGVLYK